MKLTLAALLAASALVPAAALAQTATNAAEPAANVSEGSGTDIVVTARKREENLQEVPIAITALGSDTLQAARVESLGDVAKLTPGLIYTPLFGKQNQLPIIRGVAQTLGQLNVGVFLDGIYLSGKAAVDVELNDLARVEVIRGPQSALYGRNTFAGAINYVTQRPSAQLSGRAEVTVGEHGQIKTIGRISGPISETLRATVGGYYKKFDGFYTSAIDGGRVDFEKSYGASGTLEWQPDSQFIVTLRGTYYKNDDGQPASNVIRNNASLGTPSGGSATQQRNLLYVGRLPSIATNGVLVNTTGVNIQPGTVVPTVYRNVNGAGATAITGAAAAFPAITFFGDREEAVRASGTIQYDADDVRLTSMTSYAYRSFDYTYDGDNTICDRTTPIPANPPFIPAAIPAGGCPNFGYPFAAPIGLGVSQLGLSSSIGFSRDISQELRAQSTGNGKLSWLIGGFYYNNVTDSIDRSLSGSPLTQTTANNFLFNRTAVRTQSYSAFASLGYALTDALHVTGELRYEYEEQNLFIGITNPAGGGLPANPPSAPGANATVVTQNVSNAFDLRQTFHFATPRVIVDYRLSSGNLLYASYARGAKTGGFNTGTNVRVNQRTYNPEYADNYEIGIKTTSMNRTLRANAAAYLIDWSNQQVVEQNPASDGGSSTNRSYNANSGASRIYGLELDAAWQPAPWFGVTANYAYTHARYRKFGDPSLAATYAILGLTPIDFNGKSLPYVPEHKFVISPTFTFALGEGASVEARADIQHQSETYLRADNLATFAPRTTLDLRVTARYKGAYLQLFANNVTDVDTPVAGVRFFDSVNYSVSSPYITGVPRRQLGATLGYKF